MRLLLTVGYNHLLLGYACELGPIMAALDGARVVESEGYGKERIFKLTDNQLEIAILSDLDPGLPDNQDRELVAAQKLAREQRSQIYQLEQKLKKLENKESL